MFNPLGIGKIIVLCMVLITCNINAEESPILDYRSIYPNKQNSESEKLYIYDLAYTTVTQVSPLLRSICNDCHWYLDHYSQKVGITTTSSIWRNYLSAIKLIDKKIPMVRLKVDVIEISDISNETYQHLFYKLAKPIVISDINDVSKEIEFLISNGSANIVSSPRVITKSGKPAIINIGDKIPYASIYTTNSSSARKVEYIDSGISLHITPLIHSSKQINMDLKLDYKTVNGYRSEDQFEMPMFASRETELSIQVMSGDTIVFAGLLDTSTHYSQQKVPILGDIPLIGVFFQRTISKKKHTDLIYKVTPTLIF